MNNDLATGNTEDGPRPAARMSAFAQSKTLDQEAIDRLNEKFLSMNIMEKRVAIAKEVIMEIGDGSFMPGSGYGMFIKPNTAEPTLIHSELFDINEIMQTSGISCLGCAVSAAVVANLTLSGKKIKRVISGSAFSGAVNHNNLEPFGELSFGIIESMYEGWELSGYVMNNIGDDAIQSFNDLSKNLPGDRKERMIAIFQSIIDNEGAIVIGNFKF